MTPEEHARLRTQIQTASENLTQAYDNVAEALGGYVLAFEMHQALAVAHEGLAKERAAGLGLMHPAGGPFLTDVAALAAQIERASALDVTDFVVSAAAIDRNRALVEGEDDPVYFVTTSANSTPHGTLGLVDVAASAVKGRMNVAGGGHG